MNVGMPLTGHLRGVTSVLKTTDNSQVDLAKVEFDFRLNLAREHDFGKCGAFDELAKILRTHVDKKNISPELQKLVFVNDNNNENAKNVEFNGECDVCLDGGKLHGINEDTTTKKVVDYDWLVSICEAGEAAPMHAKTKLDEYSSDGDVSLSQDEQWSMEPVAWSVDSAIDGSPVGDDPISAAVALGATTPTPTECLNIDCDCNNPPTETHSDEKSPDAAVADLKHTFMCVMYVLSTEGNDDPADDVYAVHEANYILVEDYAQELAFLSDLTEPSVTELDYTAPNVKNSSFGDDQQRRLDDVLKMHEVIMISSGNALPPPAYEVVCEIDVQGHAPIKQRARRIPLRHLQKLYDLLNGLLKAGLIAFSDSPWASPIVMVLKKNDQNIRLCIDYRMVNAVTLIMKYAMPLVDDLLTELENYLWFLALNAVRIEIAPMIYQRTIDNALSGFVQPKGGWERYAERMKLTEEAAKYQRLPDDDSDFTLTTSRTKFETDRQASSELDPVLRMVNDPYADMFATNKPDESLLVPVF
ncbi:hypothetical protein PHMEG_00023383 [Phytophthora megakarya]|uniref:Reverse transcriptase n=1 Tax=Phytophthora megakarya TaxID=4795 RepID=A0A225VH00_9STRA|nr:hypothetical protein PHMEG_00023383 [Phytophthora megakarya]